MTSTPSSWDYLVVTASNDRQAQAYETQLRLRRELGLMPQVRESFVVADLEGRRIGSGGSTIYCLARILEREGQPLSDVRGSERILRRLRILIVHAGGDSRRLPAYGPCGKIFVPVPGETQAGLAATLFDLLVPDFLALPPGASGRGQIVVAAGDALVRFDSSNLRLDAPGMTVLGCYAEPSEASRHGVYCLCADDSITLYLQKPSVEEQKATGAINAAGKTALDLGVMSLDAEAAAVLLDRFDFAGPARDRILRHGLDLYREICCAMGSAATVEHYIRSARGSGSTWSGEMLAAVYPALRNIPFHVQLVPDCRFLHFGSTRQLVESGLALVEQARGEPPTVTTLAMNNSMAGGAAISGPNSWVEGCRLSAPLDLAGSNVVVGVDVDEPLRLPPEACLDVLRGRDRRGSAVWFVRCYGVKDQFKDSVSQGARFCGRPLVEWISTVGVDPDEVWPDQQDPARRSLWNARVFPVEPAASGFRRWLWMYQPETASAAEKRAFLSAERYSAAEMAVMADQGAFHLRRIEIWAGEPRHAESLRARVKAIAETCFSEFTPELPAISRQPRQRG
ncbi:MAG: L-fucokinase [Bryobacteraceae bacterium]|jgi:fucokinase